MKMRHEQAPQFALVQLFASTGTRGGLRFAYMSTLLNGSCMGFQCVTVSVYYRCTSLSEKIQILSGDVDVIAGGRDLVFFFFIV